LTQNLFIEIDDILMLDEDRGVTQEEIVEDTASSKK